ncbi:hypothetical protein PFBG_02578 [Plasmodium falciparum 7G8]|nr:hypothetical protein PFNF135_02666 [Plasmodium falciparum NF135/5.C10]EUR72487.1 hypothetical protein PFBG_02578 [Plasmodium falciparum 7G8]
MYFESKNVLFLTLILRNKCYAYYILFFTGFISVYMKIFKLHKCDNYINYIFLLFEFNREIKIEKNEIKYNY